MDQISKEKFETITRLLNDEYLLVHVNTVASGVVLPTHVSANNPVTLKLSRLFRGGIELKPEAIVTDLLFNGNYFTCHIPLESIWGVTSVKGSNVIWPETTPVEVLKGLLQPQPASEPEEKPDTKSKKQRSHLTRVK